jgi:hypothetical protein
MKTLFSGLESLSGMCIQFQIKYKCGCVHNQLGQRHRSPPLTYLWERTLQSPMLCLRRTEEMPETGGDDWDYKGGIESDSDTFW